MSQPTQQGTHRKAAGNQRYWCGHGIQDSRQGPPIKCVSLQGSAHRLGVIAGKAGPCQANHAPMCATPSGDNSAQADAAAFFFCSACAARNAKAPTGTENDTIQGPTQPDCPIEALMKLK